MSQDLYTLADGTEVKRCFSNYLRLVDNYPALFESLHFFRFSRCRTSLPAESIPCQWFETLPGPARLWLSRLHAFYMESNSSSALCGHAKFCFAILLEHDTIDGFNTMLQNLKPSLSAVTYRKGLYSIVEAAHELFGKRLSKLDSKCDTRRQIEHVQDLAGKWNTNATYASNIVEAKLIRQHYDAPSFGSSLQGLYVVLEIESHWYFQLITQLAHSDTELMQLTGFVVFAFSLHRPASRAELVNLFKLDQLSSTLVLFPNHKTSSSFGALPILISPELHRVLTSYVTIIRPKLVLSGFFSKSSKKLLFPGKSLQLLESFLKNHVRMPDPITMSQIRKLFCGHVGAIPQNSPFFRFKADLQSVAAHQVRNGKVIEQHYEVSSKVGREKLLQRYLKERFIMNAIQIVHSQFLSSSTAVSTDVAPPSALSSSSSSSSSSPSPSPSPSPSTAEVRPSPVVSVLAVPSPVLVLPSPCPRKRKRFVSASGRLCKNRLNSKKCFSETVTFDPENSLFCNSCKQRYGDQGRYKKLKIKE